MTDLKTYFASPEKVSSSSTTDAPTNTQEAAQPTTVNGDDSSSTTTTTIPFVVKKPANNSKLILQNMEEVLNSVKKKHRQKHKRKKELKRLALLEAEAAAAASGHPPNPLEKSKASKSERKERKHHKKPLQEKATQENGLIENVKTKRRENKSPQKALHPSESILKHFQRTPKKEDAEVAAEDAIECKTEQPANKQSLANEGKSGVRTNAFEVMMNARNKSIGSNTPGKEPQSSPTQSETSSSSNVKRKLLLHDWAAKKGAKRKMEEESRAAYVNQQLENRAKRFKKMLVNGSSPKKTDLTTQTEKTTNENTNKQNYKKSTVTEEKPTSSRSKTRARARLISSSEDLKESVDIQTVDQETAEFLSKLSSPTKKRDSLLGYFPKKESPKELAENTAKEELKEKLQTRVETIKNETPKRRSKRSNAKNSTPQIDEVPVMSAADVNPETITTATTTSTPSGRPKRSCAGKARYDYDSQESPTKNAKDTPNRGMAKTNKNKKNDVIEVIELDDSNSNMNDSTTTTTTAQTPKILAPLFLRAMPKPTPDPELLKARHDFLMSSVPDKIRLEQAKQKQYEQSYEETLEIFPKIAHIRQWNKAQLKDLHASTIDNFKFKLLSEIAAPTPPPLATSAYSRKFTKPKVRSVAGITNCTLKDFRMPHKTLLQQQQGDQNKSIQSLQLPTLENKRSIVKMWKQEFERFPTYKCYNQMREKYRFFSAIDSEQDTHQVGESLVVTRVTRRSLEAAAAQKLENIEEKPPAAAPNGELMFTEKYKPMLYEQVLVNLIPVTQFRDFLVNWSNTNNGAGSSRNSQTLEDSMDIANDSNSSQQVACNSVVLLGPTSSGKTNAVFALANELNFNVLEINAGMKRTGKKLIQELQEATQSHQIRKEAPGAAASSSMGTKAQKSLLKFSLNDLKNKKRQASKTSDNIPSPVAVLTAGGDSSSSIVNAENATRKCLILIEDADIVFEQTDAGFTDAINTLAASSKRPVIIVAQQSNCAHLQRLMLQNTVQFTQPNVLNISRFLAVLSLIENCPINLDDIISLYLYNCKDLRKTVLELQFFIQSGGDRCRQTIEQSKQEQKQQEESKDGQFYASPSKRRFSEEQNACTNGGSQQDDKLANPSVNDAANACNEVYTHRSLFEFYTIGQNEKFRIPFPVDIQLLHINLCELFQNAQNLTLPPSSNGSNNNANSAAINNTATKRKSRSPKKAWLSSINNSNSNNNKSTINKTAKTPLNVLCDFYENISIASNLCLHNADAYGQADRLIPHLNEDIAHHLVEGAITVNLAAKPCPYNLFDTPKERHSLGDYLGLAMQHTKRSNALDFEPALRSICRSEKLRATMERRSTRFYHYLRNYSVNMCNFSTEPYDKACDILQAEPEQKETAVSSDATASSET